MMLKRMGYKTHEEIFIIFFPYVSGFSFKGLYCDFPLREICVTHICISHSLSAIMPQALNKFKWSNRCLYK